MKLARKVFGEGQQHVLVVAVDDVSVLVEEKQGVVLLHEAQARPGVRLRAGVGAAYQHRATARERQLAQLR